MSRSQLCSLVGACVLAATTVAVASGQSARYHLAASSDEVGPSLFVSPAGDDRGTCHRTRPCRSFDRAYRLAAPGAVVEVREGTYPPQVIHADPGKASARHVTLEATPRGRVTVTCPDGGAATCIQIYASNVTLDGFRTAEVDMGGGVVAQGSVDTERGATGITLQNLDIGAVAIGSSDTRVVSSDLGPSVDLAVMLIGDRDIVLDRLLIHDFRSKEQHMECVALFGARNVTIRNSEFRTCDTFSILVKPTGTIENVLIENNVFWNPGGVDQVNDIKVTNSDSPQTCDRITVRFNTVGDNIVHDVPCTNVTITGNIVRAGTPDCGGASYSLYVKGRPCGTNRVGNPRFVNAAGGDFHLRSRSPAIDRGPRDRFPRRDVDGQRRPLRAAPDIGFDEVP